MEAEAIIEDYDRMMREATTEPILPRAVWFYELRLTPWEDNSCWIDAVVETFWHAIIPALLPYGILDDESQANNTIDAMLGNTYRLSTTSFEDRIVASDTIRNYVWSTFGPPFIRGHQLNVLHFLTILLQKASPAFNSFFAINRQVLKYCKDQQCQRTSHDDGAQDRRQLTIVDWSLRYVREYGLHERPDRFSKVLHDYLFNVRERKCDVCNGPATRETVKNGRMPLCLFIMDPHINLGDSMESPDAKMCFPYEFSLPEIGATYTLRAIICSTQRHGHHFKTVATIRGTNSDFLAEIDNLQDAMKIMIDQPYFNPATAAAACRSVTHPIILVYLKQVALYADNTGEYGDAGLFDDDDERWMCHH